MRPHEGAIHSSLGAQGGQMATLDARTMALGLFLGVGSMAGCSGPASKANTKAPSDSTGFVGISLQVAPGVSIHQVDWTISNPALLASDRTGTVDVSQSATIQFVVGGLPAGGGYAIALRATTSTGLSCTGSGTFSVAAGVTASVTAGLVCGATSVDAGTNGSVAVGGTASLASCAAVSSLSASPSSVDIGGVIALSAQGVDSSGSSSDVSLSWTATAGPGNGTFSSPTSASPTFTCTEAGPVTVTVTVTVEDADAALCTNDTASVSLTCTPCGTGTSSTDGGPCQSDTEAGSDASTPREVVVVGGGTSGQFEVLDFSNPPNAGVAATVSAGFSGSAVVGCSGSTVAVGELGGTAVLLYDVTNPASPTLVGGLAATFGAIGALKYSGNNVLVEGAHGLILIDASNPSSPRIASTVGTPTAVDSIALSGSHAVAATTNGTSIEFLDFTSPSQPTVLPFMPNFPGNFTVAISGDVVAVGAPNVQVIQLVDFGTPSGPPPLPLIPVNLSSIVSLAMSNSFIVINGKNNGDLARYNGPPDPSIGSINPFPGGFTDLQFNASGTKLFTAGPDNSVRDFTIANNGAANAAEVTVGFAAGSIGVCDF